MANLCDINIDNDAQYEQVCNFCEECEVRNVHLKEEEKQAMFKFIVNYRLNYSMDRAIEDSFVDRIKLLIKVIEEFSVNEFKFESNGEMVVFLKFVVKQMNVLKHDKSTQKIPWSQLHFVVCIFIGTKTNSRRKISRFIDGHFQLIFSDDVIWSHLRLLLMCLVSYMSNYSIECGDGWNELKSIYKLTRNYYLLQKIKYYLRFLQYMNLNQFRNKPKAFERVLHAVADCLLEQQKLNYSTFDLEITTNLLKIRLIAMRHNLSHANFIEARTSLNVMDEQRFSEVQIDVLKLVTFTTKSIINEKTVIEKRFLEMSLNEPCLRRLQEVIKGIQCKLKHFKWTESEGNYLTDTVKTLMTEIRTEFGDQLEIVDVVHQIEALLIQVELKLNECEPQYDIFNMIRTIQNDMCPENKIRARLNSFWKLVNINLFVQDGYSIFSWNPYLSKLVKLLPTTSNVRAKVVSFHSQLLLNDKMFLLTSKINQDDEDIIENTLYLIEKFITDLKEKLKFKAWACDLKVKRFLLATIKETEDVESVRSDWPIKSKKAPSDREITNHYDLLKNILECINKNLPLDKVVGVFLRHYSGKLDKVTIVQKVKETTDANLKIELAGKFERLRELRVKEEFDSYDQLEAEMYFVECYEIMKLLGFEFRLNGNYLDNECAIPVGRNLRNYLTHGDVYQELFMDNFSLIVKAHISIFATLEVHNPRKLGFQSKTDLNKVYNNFKKHLNYVKYDGQALSLNCKGQDSYKGTLGFKFRDNAGLTIVHYNLRIRDESNEFLNYLILKVTEDKHFQIRPSFEEMLDESKDVNYFVHNFNTQPGLKMDDYIRNFIETTDYRDQRRILCQILSFPPTSLDTFQRVFVNEESKPSLQDDLLIIACAYNNEILVDYLIENTFYGNALDIKCSGTTALQVAVDKDNTKLVKLLVEKGARLDIYKPQKYHFTPDLGYMKALAPPVCIAAQNGSLDMLKTLHILGADFSEFDGLNYTPLHLSILYGDYSMCKFLVEICKVALTACSIYGELPLGIASFLGKHEVVQLLIENGADPQNAGCGLTALHFACDSDNSELVEYLIEMGVPVNLNAQLLTPIRQACVSNRLENVKILLKNGADVLTEEVSPMAFAFYSESIEIVDELLKAGCLIHELPLGFLKNVKFCDEVIKRVPDQLWSCNRQLLKKAIINNRIEIVRIMLKHLKALIQPLRIDELVASVDNYYTEMFKMLINYPILDLTAADLENLLIGGVGLGSLEVLRSILRKGANINHSYTHMSNLTILHMVCSNVSGPKAISLVRFCIENGANVNVKDDKDLTPLITAALKGKHEIVEILLENKADASARVNFESKFDAMEIAIQKRRLKAIKLLHNFDFKNSFYISMALHYFDQEIVDYFLDFDYDVNWSMESGDNPLCIAIHLHNYQIIARLLAKGAVIEGAFRPLSPLTIALHLQDATSIDLLKDYVIKIKENN